MTQNKKFVRHGLREKLFLSAKNMAPFELKEATTNDIALISRLGHDIWREVYPPIIGSAQVEYMLEKMYNYAALEEQMKDLGHKFFIAMYSGQDVGFVSFSFHHGELANRTRIHKLYLLPSMQGKGLGAQMVKYVEALSKENNDVKLELNVNKNNPALHFYNRLGFAIEKDVVIDIGNGYVMDDYVMFRLHQ